MNENEKKSLYIFNNMEGMYSDKLMKIYDYFGSYEEALKFDAEEFYKAGIFIKAELADKYNIVRNNAEKLLLRYEQLLKDGVRIISFEDSEYPKRLNNIENRPPLIYVSGKLPDENRHTAGIIGSRKCSEYGRSVSEFFAAELARENIQIISGLAYGIDGAAAYGSLKAAGESYAVLGCGVNICYPKENWPMYSRMKEGEGGIISEFPPDKDALGFHFVLRNRIIAGLSDVLLVIEAAEKSGTYTTVEYALDQGKEVFALPGRITDPLGFGCNRMLKDGAGILTSPTDILEFFGIEDDKILRMGEKDLSRLERKEQKIYKVLQPDSQHVETIARRCGISIGEVLSVLSSLEAKGYAVSPRAAYYRKN